MRCFGIYEGFVLPLSSSPSSLSLSESSLESFFSTVVVVVVVFIASTAGGVELGVTRSTRAQIISIILFQHFAIIMRIQALHSAIARCNLRNS